MTGYEVDSSSRTETAVLPYRVEDDRDRVILVSRVWWAMLIFALTRVQDLVHLLAVSLAKGTHSWTDVYHLSIYTFGAIGIGMIATMLVSRRQLTHSLEWWCLASALTYVVYISYGLTRSPLLTLGLRHRLWLLVAGSLLFGVSTLLVMLLVPLSRGFIRWRESRPNARMTYFRFVLVFTAAHAVFQTSDRLFRAIDLRVFYFVSHQAVLDGWMRDAGECLPASVGTVLLVCACLTKRSRRARVWGPIGACCLVLAVLYNQIVFIANEGFHTAVPGALGWSLEGFGRLSEACAVSIANIPLLFWPAEREADQDSSIISRT